MMRHGQRVIVNVVTTKMKAKKKNSLMLTNKYNNKILNISNNQTKIIHPIIFLIIRIIANKIKIFSHRTVINPIQIA